MGSRPMCYRLVKLIQRGWEIKIILNYPKFKLPDFPIILIDMSKH